MRQLSRKVLAHTHTHTRKGLLSVRECSSVSTFTDAAFRM